MRNLKMISKKNPKDSKNHTPEDKPGQDFCCLYLYVNKNN